uniref:Reverse transcriptase domain-containing protein n=1 Tax=Fagus sylvatica TaxID=28930 RepID=A0A2N9G2D1_FAGSY
MEHRGRFRGSLWLGLGGLRWLVNMLLKLRNSACTLDGFFEFFRDGYRVVKLSCLSNSGGRFLDISEYHSGARRGSIRLPEGRRGAGWSLFEFPGSCNVSWNQNRQDRKSWAFRKNAGFAPKLTKTVTISDTEKKSRIKVDMATKAPRLTRLSHFEWKPKSTTLLSVDQWAFKLRSPTAQCVEQRGGGGSFGQQEELGQTVLCWRSFLEPKSLIRSQRLVIQSMRMTIPNRKPLRRLRLLVPDGVINDIQVDSGEENSCREPCGQALLPMIGADLLRDERMAVSASEASSVVMNGGEEIPLSMVVFSVDHEHKTTEAGSSVDGLVSLPASFRLEEPWNSDSVSGSPFLGDFGHYATGETQSPLSCTLLDRIDPLDFVAFTQGYTGDILALEDAMSAWVEQRYKGFKKLVEQKRLRATTGPRYPNGSVNKGIYGLNLGSVRGSFWDELTLIRNRWATPWCLFGDFNIIRFPSERLGCQTYSQGMLEFSEFIDSNQLVDLPLDGGLYTWCSGSDQPSMSCIDRVLVSADWEEHFPDVSQKLLPRPLSDHSPILVEAGGMARGKSSFKFENMWLKSEGFVDLVKGMVVRVIPSMALLVKNRAMGDILRLDEKEFQGVLTHAERLLREELKLEVDRLAHLVEVSWRQKSRVLCLKEEDNNIKFFHKMANSHRRRNQIKYIEVDGTQFEEESEIRNQVVHFYKALYHENEDWRPDVDGLSFASIGEEAKDRLERRFDKDEVVQVLKDLEGDKAPGLDGFIMAFFQKCWPVLQDDIMGFFEEVYEQGQFESSLNATFLALIPKKNDARNIKDFRPISLIGSVYKLLSKVLANRLKEVLDDLISESQNAFVGGRQMLDSVLIANECLDSRLKRRQPGVICKLDIEKAYDHVNWNCLIHLLDTMGFGTKWQGWIRACISTVRYSVLINGSPAGYFGSSRGLRQGDPLSPLLFLLVMEILSKILKKVEESGLIRGFHASRSGVAGLSISHILFADDTMIMCDADPVQLMYLRLAMTCFEASTGLRAPCPMSYLGYAFGFYVQIHFDLESYHREAGIVAKRIEQIQRKFLWGGSDDTFKHCLVKLGYYLELRTTWLWKRVLVARHGTGCGEWSTGWTRDSHGCGIWKGIMLGWTLFLVLYACASNKAATVSEVLVRENGRVRLEGDFMRNFNDWELDNVASFLGLLQSHLPSRVVDDGLWWNLKTKGIFDVRSRYSFFGESPSLVFPWKCIWRTKAPRRACFFVWTAAWKKILTCENLRKRGYYITSWCCMCRCNGETVEHLLLHCPVAGALWNWIFKTFGIHWVISGTVADLLHKLVEWFRSSFVGYLEFCTNLLDVDDLEGAQSTNF